uniref:Putative ovule protein n=1 Tax=Solanum chacoense TaxID=4108 RepID=A0A0V0GS08_SOLCH
MVPQMHLILTIHDFLPCHFLMMMIPKKQACPVIHHEELMPNMFLLHLLQSLPFLQYFKGGCLSIHFAEYYVMILMSMRKSVLIHDPICSGAFRCPSTIENQSFLKTNGFFWF